MSDDRKELDPDNPEDMKKLREYAREAAKKLFEESSESDFDERELASGDTDKLDEIEEREYLEELDEYTPEERREKFKVLKPKK